MNKYISYLYILRRHPNKTMSLLNYAFRRKVHLVDHVPPPRTIMIRITRQNNLRPTCCGKWAQVDILNEKGNNPFDQQLTTEDWKSFIEDICVFRPYIFIEGGEPFLREDIMELVDFISSKGLLCGIRTNATLLAGFASALGESGIDYLLCNLDAPELSLNAEITGKQDSFELAIKGIKAMREIRKNAGVPLIQMTTTVSRYNQGRLVDMAQLAASLGVDVFAISLPVFTTPAQEEFTRTQFKKHFGFEPKFWRSFISEAEGINAPLVEKQIRAIKSKHWNFEYRQFPPDKTGFDVSTHFHLPEKPHFDNTCLLPWLLAVIMPNGDVATCWDHPDYIAGNILKDSLVNIWNGEKYRQFRSVIRQGIFSSCSRCNGLYHK